MGISRSLEKQWLSRDRLFALHERWSGWRCLQWDWLCRNQQQAPLFVAYNYSSEHSWQPLLFQSSRAQLKWKSFQWVSWFYCWGKALNSNEPSQLNRFSLVSQTDCYQCRDGYSQCRHTRNKELRNSNRRRAGWWFQISLWKLYWHSFDDNKIRFSYQGLCLSSKI